MTKLSLGLATSALVVAIGVAAPQAVFAHTV
jgi:hypothetical protein